MATDTQRSYIKDLSVQKLKEFKEFKEMLYANGIVEKSSETVANADSVDAILDATTDLQASKMIDALIAKKEPVRSKTYSQTRSLKTIEGLDKIKEKVRSWNFNELR
jgi:2-hydroxy-3-keto-5-methylthiopentenyl-1-phosphate phosphatase